jgi:hypothetical protein
MQAHPSSFHFQHTHKAHQVVASEPNTPLKATARGARKQTRSRKNMASDEASHHRSQQWRFLALCILTLAMPMLATMLYCGLLLPASSVRAVQYCGAEPAMVSKVHGMHEALRRLYHQAVGATVLSWNAFRSQVGPTVARMFGPVAPPPKNKTMPESEDEDVEVEHLTPSSCQ